MALLLENLYQMRCIDRDLVFHIAERKIGLLVFVLLIKIPEEISVFKVFFYGFHTINIIVKRWLILSDMSFTLESDG